MDPAQQSDEWSGWSNPAPVQNYDPNEVLQAREAVLEEMLFPPCGRQHIWELPQQHEDDMGTFWIPHQNYDAIQHPLFGCMKPVMMPEMYIHMMREVRRTPWNDMTMDQFSRAAAVDILVRQRFGMPQHISIRTQMMLASGRSCLGGIQRLRFPQATEEDLRRAAELLCGRRWNATQIATTVAVVFAPRAVARNPTQALLTASSTFRTAVLNQSHPWWNRDSFHILHWKGPGDMEVHEFLDSQDYLTCGRYLFTQQQSHMLAAWHIVRSSEEHFHIVRFF